MGFLSLLSLVAAVTYLCLSLILYYPHLFQWDLVNLSTIASSEVVSPVVLLLSRLFMAAVIWSIIFYLLTDKVGLIETIPDRQGVPKKLHLFNFQRFTMFTGTTVVYFCICFS